MNGIVFIGWTRSNEMAKMVAEKLKGYRFDCIIGGNSDLEGNLLVANTIIDQIKASTQALFIIRKYDGDHISNNVIFEIGYSLSKFDSTLKKLHLFYLDIDSNDKSIPSDLLGMWAHHISTEGKSDDEIVDEIVSGFLRHQKSDLEVNKMKLVLDWQDLYEVVSTHLANARYSDYDMAQYMMLFIESTGLAHMWSKLRECVSEMMKVVDDSSPELYYMLRYAYALENMSHRFKFDNFNRYLDKADSRELRQEMRDLKNGLNGYIAKDDFGSANEGFCRWYAMLCDERIMYYYMLRANDPSMSDDERTKTYERAKTTAESVIEQCDRLAAENKNNVELAHYYRSMAYRNLAIIASEDKDEEAERKYRLLSFEDEKELRKKFSRSINDQRISETRDRAYYVVMAGALKYIEDEEEREDYQEELREYSTRMSNQRDSTTMYVNKINRFLDGKPVRGM